MQKEFKEAVERFQQQNIQLVLIRQLTSGKEATVFLVEDQAAKTYALKVYQDSSRRSFKKKQQYLAGKYARRLSEGKAMSKRNKFGKNLLQRLWIKREFYLLTKLYQAGASIPEPIAMVNNAILMELIGDINSPAMLLKDVSVDLTESKKIYQEVIKNIKLFAKQGIVHGDLSPFNILYTSGNIYIIDFPQALDMRNNPNAQEMLARDYRNIEEWYQKVQAR